MNPEIRLVRGSGGATAAIGRLFAFGRFSRYALMHATQTFDGYPEDIMHHDRIIADEERRDSDTLITQKEDLIGGASERPENILFGCQGRR